MPLSAYQTPGIYMEEISTGARPIQAVGTSTAGFVGQAPDAGARVNEAVAIKGLAQTDGSHTQCATIVGASPAT